VYILSCRDYGGGVVEMVCTFENFNTEILKTPLPYKYVIHSPKEKKPEVDCYEYLHAHSSRWTDFYCNRCLVIQAKDRHFPAGMKNVVGMCLWVFVLVMTTAFYVCMHACKLIIPFRGLAQKCKILYPLTFAIHTTVQPRLS
jgi:hypothetical protein